MKILYYCDWFKEYTASLAAAVATQSDEVSVIVRENSVEFESRRADEESVHRELVASGIELRQLAGKYSSMKSVRALNRIYREKRKAGYDRFHLQQTGDPRFILLASRMPTVLTLHEPAARHGVVSGADRLRELANGTVERVYRRLADVIVVHTEGNFNALTPSERRKAVVIPHGVAPLPSPSRTDSTTILFFGRAAAYKGLDTLLGAMEKVWAVRPDARLRILASPGDYAPVDSADSRICATWSGYSNEELQVQLAAARVVCLPYTSASGSGAGAQAYGSGKPIVASDLEGLRALVPDNELLARPGDQQDLARALVAALNNEYGRQELDPTRTWSGVAEAHIKAYRSLSDPPTPSGAP